MKYNTRQRDAILNFFKSHSDECFTAKEIFEITKGEFKEATIYRTLSVLTEKGEIKRFARNDKSAATYQLNKNESCHNHFHLKCNGCGKLIHMNCDVLSKMNEHIENDHDFHIDSSATVFYGQCVECFRKGGL